MHPKIEKFKFGTIVIDGQTLKKDILIRLDGTITKREKKLSKELYGTSHIMSLAEAEYTYEEGAQALLYGTGQFGRAGLSEEAQAFFQSKDCTVELLPTGDAIQRWNHAAPDFESAPREPQVPGGTRRPAG